MRYGDNWVLESGRYTYHVPSDNAMIDSGEGEYVVCWLAEAGVTRRYENGLGRDGCQRMQLDATETPLAVREQAMCYQRAVAWVVEAARRISEAARADEQISAGDTVEVFKGRKCPKGRYTVVKAGKNDWGTYCHLRPVAGGAEAKFIPQGNMRKAKAAPTVPQGVPAVCYPMLARLAGLGVFGYGDIHQHRERHAAALALADALEEMADDRAGPIRAWANYYFGPRPEAERDDYGRSFNFDAAADYFTRPVKCYCGTVNRLPVATPPAPGFCTRCFRPIS